MKTRALRLKTRAIVICPARKASLKMTWLDMCEKISLTDLPRALRVHGANPSYLQCWRAVVAGDVPAERAGSRWTIRAADLPEIARTFPASR
jgi:hypothetical protein